MGSYTDRSYGTGVSQFEWKGSGLGKFNRGFEAKRTSTPVIWPLFKTETLLKQGLMEKEFKNVP